MVLEPPLLAARHQLRLFEHLEVLHHPEPRHAEPCSSSVSICPAFVPQAVASSWRPGQISQGFEDGIHESLR